MKSATAKNLAISDDGEDVGERMWEHCLFPLKAMKVYLLMVTMRNVPCQLPVDEANSNLVEGLKQITLGIVQPLMDPGRVKWAMGFDKELASDIKQNWEEVLQLLHEYVEIIPNGLGDDLANSLIFFAAKTFFLPKSDLKRCSAAESLLVTLYARRPTLRAAILDEVGSGTRSIPIKAKDRAPFMIPNEGMSVWTRLFLRLMQATAVPLGIFCSNLKIRFFVEYA